MRLLVVTPTLGKSRWLVETMASVAALPIEHVHVLVAPPSAVPGIAARFPRARVIAENAERSGMYAAINTGVAAGGDWHALTYINDDDLLLPELATVWQKMPDLREPWIGYGGVRLIDEQGRRIGRVPVCPFPRWNRRLYEQGIEALYQHGTLISRTAWEKAGGFDASLRLCGDSEFFARAARLGIAMACATRRDVAAFRLRSEQLSKNDEAMRTERAIVWRKYGLEATARTWRHVLARWIFRSANIAVYGERVRRHGWVSMAQVNRRAR
jgi:GT2 family glycosyltransferase